MPRGDGTGPAGWGPMTGRAAGYCAGYNMPGYMSPVPGRGFWGRGRGGGGRGWRNWYYATGLTGWQRGAMRPFGPYGAPYAAPYAPPPVTAEQEREALQAQVKSLEAVLEDTRKRLQELESEAKEK
jgi:hypothetical protein